MSENNEYIMRFRKHIQRTYNNASSRGTFSGGFDEILCYELHSQPINPRMRCRTNNNGFETGLTFRELAEKWGISTSFLGELIADHCRKLDG